MARPGQPGRLPAMRSLAAISSPDSGRAARRRNRQARTCQQRRTSLRRRRLGAHPGCGAGPG